MTSTSASMHLFYRQVVSAGRIGQKYFPNVRRNFHTARLCCRICCHVTTVTRKLPLFFSTNVHCFDKLLSGNTLTSCAEMVSRLLDKLILRKPTTILVSYSVIIFTTVLYNPDYLHLFLTIINGKLLLLVPEELQYVFASLSKSRT